MAFGTDASNRMGSPQALGGQFYNKSIDQSLRFNDDDSAYLSRTPGSASNRKTWTWSGWVKRGNIKSAWTTLFASASGSQYTSIGIKGSGADQLRIVQDNGAGGVYELLSSAILRDTSAWYHIVVAMDTTQATSSDRIKFYINGEQQSVTGSYPSQNLDTWISNTQTHYLGGWPAVSEFLDGYLAEIHFIDGTALGPEYFAEDKNGIWIPKRVTGVTYGTNGFHLDFADSGAIGTDVSGNGNDWTVNNLVASDVVPDSPTNNFVTLNPNYAYQSSGTNYFAPTLSEGNLKAAYSSGPGEVFAVSTLFIDSGKWYAEVRSFAGFGWVGISHFTNSATSSGYAILSEDGSKNYNGTSVSAIDSVSDGDIIGIALDLDSGTIEFFINNISQTQRDISSFTGSGKFFAFGVYTSDVDNIVQYNFGQDSTFAGSIAASSNTAIGGGEFKYQPPAGYKALKVQNLPEPTFNPKNESIENSYFYTTLYEGNGGGQRVGQFLPLNEVKTVNNAIRFEDGDTAYLTRTPGSAGNLRNWTFSAWVKRSNVGIATTLFSAQTDVNNWMYIGFLSGDTLTWQQAVGASVTVTLTTSQLFRDTSKWYHIVCVLDSNQATAADRQKIYIDGELVTSFGTSTYIGQNIDSWLNKNVAHQVGRYISAANYMDGYMADVHFVDAQSLTPTSFGQTDPSTEKWIPKTFTGNHGQNGFHLEFLNNEVGADSANTNSFTPVNLTTANTVIDTPTKNFMTLDPNTVGMTGTLSEGNLKVVTQSTGSDPNTQGTFGVRNGKWYWETYLNDTSVHYQIGITRYQMPGLADVGSGEHHVVARAGAGATRVDTADVETGLTALNAGDILGQALDMDNKTIQFYNNGVAFGSAVSFNGLFDGEDVTPYIVDAASGITVTAIYNFGQDSSFAGSISPAANTDGLGAEFKYTPPSGYKALNVDNLPAKGTRGIARRKQPALTWIKNRDATDSHVLVDQVRGAGDILFSNETSTANTNVNSVQKFLPGGFQIGNDVKVNTAGESYVAWNWAMHDDVINAGPVSNSDGSITSSVIADKKLGFSIVSYTGTGVSATVGHGLSQAPEIILLKKRTNDTQAWQVYHAYNTSEPETEKLTLNTNAATVDDHTTWNDTSPTSSVFSIGTGSGTNENTDTYIAYLWHAVPGFSAFGSYIGNGSANGTYVHLGFKPVWVMIKSITTAQSWEIRDNKREPFNDASRNVLFADISGAETVDSFPIDFTSNGFKLRNSGNGTNASGVTFIYLAFAESPFKYANAR